MSQWNCEEEGMLQVKSEKMKSEKVKAVAKALWAFCSYVFWPQRRPKELS